MIKKINKTPSNERRSDLNRRYKQRIDKATLRLVKTVLLTNNEVNVAAAEALARALNYEGINQQNYLLFFTLLETNNAYVANSLIGERDPFLLFSPISPNWYLIKEVFRMLTRYKRGQLYNKCLYPLLGVIQGAYKTSIYGYSIYPLNISDINNFGKYLDTKKDQLDRTNRLILDLLYDIYQIGIDSLNYRAKLISIHCNAIRMAFFDNKKTMVDAIPDVLLTAARITRDTIKPQFGKFHEDDISAGIDISNGANTPDNDNSVGL